VKKKGKIQVRGLFLLSVFFFVWIFWETAGGASKANPLVTSWTRQPIDAVKAGKAITSIEREWKIGSFK
jgi:hypothetical protein